MSCRFPACPEEIKCAEGECKHPKLREFSLHSETVLAQFSAESVIYSLKSMSQDDLLRIRGEIDGKLTGITLADVNLVKETLIQLQMAKALQAKANGNNDVPVNQLAQVQNSLASILERLAKTQEGLYTSETVKRMKASLVKIVKQLPKEAQEAFFESLAVEFKAAQAEMEG